MGVEEGFEVEAEGTRKVTMAVLDRSELSNYWWSAGRMDSIC